MKQPIAGHFSKFSGPKSCRVLALSYCFWTWYYQLSIEYIKCRLYTLFFGPEKLSSFGLVLLFLALVLSIINWIHQMQAFENLVFQARELVEFYKSLKFTTYKSIIVQQNLHNKMTTDSKPQHVISYIACSHFPRYRNLTIIYRDFTFCGFIVGTPPDITLCSVSIHIMYFFNDESIQSVHL
jgi:hypothetical protein